MIAIGGQTTNAKGLLSISSTNTAAILILVEADGPILQLAVVP